MNTDDFRYPLRAMRDAYAATVCDLATLRRYLAERYDDPDPDPLAWLTDGRGSSRNHPNSWENGGVFWQAWHAAQDAILSDDAESDEITEMIYEEALADGEPWAEEAHNRRAENVSGT